MYQTERILICILPFLMGCSQGIHNLASQGDDYVYVPDPRELPFTNPTPVENIGIPIVKNSENLPYDEEISASLLVGDYDRDGIQDLLLTRGNDYFVQFRKGRAAGVFDSEVSNFMDCPLRQIVTADFNADNILDFAGICLNSATIEIQHGLGNGLFQSAQKFATEADPISIVAANLVTGGSPELAVLTRSSQKLLVYGRSTAGQWSEIRRLDLASRGSVLRAGLLDADTLVDLAVLSREGRSIEIFQGGAAGALTSRARLTTGENPTDLQLGDFDGDQILDLVVATNRQGAIHIFQNQRNFAFSAPVQNTSTSRGARLALGTLTTRVGLDLAVLDHQGRGVAVVEGLNDTTLNSPGIITLQNKPLAFALGDFNGDGRADIVVTTTVVGELVTILSQ